MGRLTAQVLNVAQTGVIESGYGVTPNLTGATSVFVSGNYAYVVGTGDVLEILDITLPGLPIHKGSLNNGAGGASILRPQSVFVSGNYAYITSYGNNTLEIIDVSNPAAPVHKGSLADGSGGAPFLNEPFGLYVSGNYAFVASAGSNTLEIIDVSNPSVPVHKGSLTDGSGSSPFLAGPVSVYVSGNYAYIGSNGALEIADVSNPAAPVHVASMQDGNGNAPYLNQVYSIAVANGLAYVTDMAGAIDIIDVTNPAVPLLKGTLKNNETDPPYLYAPFSISVSGHYAYVSNIGSALFPSHNTASGALEVIDVSDPSAPVHKTALIDVTCINSRSVFISDNIAYTTSRKSNSLNIIDVTNPAALTILSSTQSGSGGALLNGAQSVYVSGNYAYVASQTSNCLEILDISIPSSPTHKGVLADKSGGAQLSGAVSVFVSGNYAYVASKGSDALEIVDVSNPALPTHKGSVSLLLPSSGNSGTASAVYVSGSYAYVVSNDANALIVIDVSNPASPSVVGTLVDGSGGAKLTDPRSVFVSGSNAYIASYGNNALEVVDVSQPGAPYHKGSLQNGSNGALLNQPTSVFVSGNYAYVVGAGRNALEVVDISNPSTPAHAGSLADGEGNAPFLNTPTSVFVSGNYAYVASSGSQAIEVVNISQPTNPIHHGSLTNGNSGALLDGPTSVFIAGNYGYATNSNLYQNVDVFYLYGLDMKSFTPVTGQAGTSVAIEGENFNTFVTASINGIQAPVTHVTASTLTVTIPDQASIGKIQLSYSGQNVFSASNFIVTPSATAATEVSITGLTANWSDVGAVGHYLDVSTDNFKTFVDGYNNRWVSDNMISLSGLQPATHYQYRVRSTDGSVISNNSNIISSQTISSTPVAKTASGITETSFTANWSSVKGASGYYFDVSSDSSFTRSFIVGYNNLNVSGASDSTQYVTGLSPFTSYYYRVRSYDSAGVSGSSAVITVFTPDNNAPQITLSATNATTITYGDSPLFKSSITDNVHVDEVWFYYRGISHQSFNTLALTGTNGNYSVTIQSSWLDSLGLEYYFMARDEAGNKAVSTTSYAQVIYPTITFPTLPSGDTQNSYRIVSFPYSLSSENLAAFFLTVPLDDPTKVAIWWWDPSLKNGSGAYSKLQSGSTTATLDPGKGYWVLLRDPVTPQFTNVTAPGYNRSNLYSMTLKPGWNEIGNPYPVDLSWDDVTTFNAKANPEANFSPLNIFDGTGFKQATGSSSFKAFSGGFVKNTGSSDVVIQVPFPGQQSIGDRISSTDEEQYSWRFSLKISQQELTNELGGFGMHPQAQPGPDRFDNFNPPALMNVPEINFFHTDYSGILFSKDIVPSQSSYHWQFTPKGQVGESAELTWIKNEEDQSNKPLYLYDDEFVQLVDMNESDSYRFTLTEKSQFDIYYGTDLRDIIASSKIEIGAPYPNPIENGKETSINISLPDQSTDYQVTIQFYTIQGDQLGTFNKVFPAGINTVTFNLYDYKTSSGIVLYKALVHSEKSSNVFTGKLVKL